MVFFNHATRQMTAKIVYYGPGLCGKTTNLNTIYAKTSQKARGEMVSLNTETDRTLFFDLLPMDVGMIGGFKTKLQLYTVPGQVFYNSTRKLVLKGVDGIVYVADSQVPMLDANKESLQNLSENLKELGLDLRDIPMVFQWNKRDLKHIVPVAQLEEELNTRKLPSFQSCAQDGTGVFETLRGITKLALAHIKTHVLGDVAAPRETPKPAQERRGQEQIPPPPPEPKPEPKAPEPPPPPPHPELPPVLELPTAASMLADLEPLPSDATQVPAHHAAAGHPRETRPPHPRESLPPMPALSIPKPAAHHAAPAVPAHKITLAPPVVPKAKAASTPKAAISSLLGDLTQMGKLGTPSILKLELPGNLDGQELEVLVQVLQKGHVIAQNHLKKPTPSKGVTSKLTVELKRS